MVTAGTRANQAAIVASNRSQLNGKKQTFWPPTFDAMISLSIRASPLLGHTTAVGRALDALETGDTPWADHGGRR